MSRRQLIDQAMQTLAQLPDDKVNEVVDFASYMLKKHEEQMLQKGIERLVESSSTFSFLHDEEDLYSVNDLKERFK